MIGVRQSLGERVAIEKWKYGFQLSGLKTSASAPLRLVAVYNNVGMIVTDCRVVTALRPVLEEAAVQDDAIVLAADWNAHVGTHPCPLLEEDDPLLIQHRSSQQVEVNAAGKILLRLCEEFDLFIVSGTKC